MKKLSKWSIVGYGAGDAANNLAFTTATMFLLVYYTDVAGISAAAAGTLLLVVRIFDAFADVFAGRVVDRAFSKRFGKFRPFIMFGSIPLLLLSVATFSVPQLGESGTLLYAYVTYAALGLATAVFAVFAGALAAWAVVVKVMRLETFIWAWQAAGLAIAIALIVTIALGLAGTWRVLGQKPARHLRSQ